MVTLLSNLANSITLRCCLAVDKRPRRWCTVFLGAILLLTRQATYLVSDWNTRTFFQQKRDYCSVFLLCCSKERCLSILRKNKSQWRFSRRKHAHWQRKRSQIVFSMGVGGNLEKRVILARSRSEDFPYNQLWCYTTELRKIVDGINR